MKYVNLGDSTLDEIRDLLKSNGKIIFTAERTFDTTLLVEINKQCGANIELQLCPDENVSIDLLKLTPNIQRLALSPDWESPLDNLEGLAEIKKLISLSLGLYVKENISFEPISHIKMLQEFEFLHKGLVNKKQYDFINQQSQLEILHVRTLDLSLIATIQTLTELRIHSTVKNENLLVDKFPKLRKFHLHGDSRRKDHSFIENLLNIEDITINYNAYLSSFPNVKSPEIVKRICMYECPNFSDIDSLLIFENLETLCLTTHNKSLQVSAEDFVKLKQLKKLNRVYVEWGRQEPKIVEQLYKETGWINSMI